MSNENAIVKCSKCLNDERTNTWIFGECLPVPAFGEINSAKVQIATVGLNPSSTEFYAGERLKHPSQRLPALSDFRAKSREDLTADDMAEATGKRFEYFNGGARQAHEWFKKLGRILNTANTSWCYADGSAVHLDIVACVTRKKWSDVNEDARKMIAVNCREHLEHTVSKLPENVTLLFDGKSSCEAMTGFANAEWKSLGHFTDLDGNSKPLRVRSGTVKIGAISRKYAAWNYPAKYLSNEALPRVGEWVRGVM